MRFTKVVLMTGLAMAVAGVAMGQGGGRGRRQGRGRLYRAPLVERDEALPNVLLLGDSISIGYHRTVEEHLRGVANVYRPNENCAGTTRGLQRIDAWIGDTDWAVIHFNWGLHDLKHVDPETGRNSTDPNDPQQASPEQYRENLTQLVARLQQTGATLIFGTTTPYPDRPAGPLRRAASVPVYNGIALEIMREAEVAVNDLHGLVAERLGDLQRENNVHFKPAGSRVLGAEVARVVREALAGR